MKPIFKALDAKTAADWTEIQTALNTTQHKTDRIGELSKIMSGMLQEFSDSYDMFNKAPPGIKETLNVMLALSSCNDEHELDTVLNKSAFLASLQKAITQVETVQSGLNHVKAGLKFIATLALFAIIAPLVFFSSAILGVIAGSPIPFVGIAMLTPLAAIPTYHTYKAGYDLLTTGINEILRTQQENRTDGKLVSQMGLFSTTIEKYRIDPPRGPYYRELNYQTPPNLVDNLNYG